MIPLLRYLKTISLISIAILVLSVNAQETEESIFIPHTNGVSEVAWSPDGKKLAANSGSEILILDTENWKSMGNIEEWSSDISWDPGSQLIAGVQGGDSERVLIWDANTGELVQELGRPRPPDMKEGGIVPQPQTVSWHPDGNIIATDASIAFDEILLWNANAENSIQEAIRVKVAKDTWHNSVNLAWSHNGEMLLSSGSDDLPPNPSNYMTTPRSYIIDKESGEILFVLSETAKAWGPYDERITSVALVESVRRITVWDWESKEALVYFDQHTSTVIPVAWNTYSPVIASADIDGNLLLWNPDTGIVYDVDEIELSGVHDLVWKPDSNILAIATNEGVLIQFYDFD